MKAKVSILLASILALGLSVGCNRSPNDAQIANDVQSKIAADTNVQNKQIGVQSANGAVTLTGTVATDMERAEVANDAAQVSGVKTVINNLQVSSVATLAEPPAAPMAGSRRAARRAAPPANRAPRTSGSSSAMPATSSSGMTANSAAPAAPRVVTVPQGTTLAVRLIDGVDTEKNKPGDTFRASLSEPVMVGDEVVIPADADVEGQVVDLKSAGHFTGQSTLALTLTRLTVNGKTYTLQTNQYSKQGSSRGTRTAETVGGGAGVGALIGAIAGGGKGAAIGAAVGAGAGTGVQAATKGQQIKLPSEAVLNFQLQGPLDVTPASSLNRNANRQRVNQ
ncbi:MAG: BON domain-containing protein [Terriglobales bacterium]